MIAKSLVFTFLSILLPYCLFGQGFADIAPFVGLQFPYGSGEYAGSASFADFNLDGLDDLTVSTNFGEPVRFFQNNGTGFTELASPIVNNTDTREIVWVDYDNDGDLDLYTTSHNGNKLFKNLGNFTFQDITASCGFWEPPLWKSYCATWTDYDKDGYPDLCVAFRVLHLVGQITMYRNLGNDQFEDVTSIAGFDGLGNSVLAMAAFDMNNDGWEDLFIGQDFQAGCLMMKNLGNGTYENISVAAGADVQNNTMTVTVGDFDNDGWFDVFLTDTGLSRFLKNNGDETFSDAGATNGLNVSGFTFGAQALDADNDGNLDLNINSTNTSRMFHNNGNGSSFTETTSAWGFSGPSTFSVGLTQGDLNGDGYPDLFKCNKNAPGNSLWQNNFTSNNYLSVDLIGTVSNGFAIGAIIKVWINGSCQMRRVGCGEGFCAQNSYTQFFGLGQQNSVDTLTVIWPSGIVNTYYNVESNQRIQLTEMLIVQGCTNEMACNFNPDAMQEDGSCIFPMPFYGCDGDCLNDTDLDGICNELEIPGCMDVEACNYSFTATDEDGSCQFLPAVSIVGNSISVLSEIQNYSTLFSEGVSYTWNISDGNEILSGQSQTDVAVVWNQLGLQWISVYPSIDDICVGDSTVFYVNVTATDISQISASTFSLHPNPTEGLVNIRVSRVDPLPAELSILDLSGRQVATIKPNAHEFQVDMRSYGAGVYLIYVGTPAHSKPMKIVLTK